MFNIKTTTLVFLAVAMGAITGLAFTVKEFVGTDDPTRRLQVRETQSAGDSLSRQQSLPQVSVAGGLIHDFGAMPIDGKGTHTFVFQNTGDAALLVKTKSTTCKCTVSQLKQEVILPGRSTDVTLKWTPNGTSPDFRQRAEIETNDPYKPIVELTIHGRVIQALVPMPQAISLRRLPASKMVNHRVVVYSYNEEKFQLTGYELLNEEQASHFNVELDLATTDEDLAIDRFAKSASALQVTIRPGLPLGPIQQKLRLRTNLPDAPYLEIPIEGTVVGDISIVGPRFSSERNLLRLGAIDGRKGISTTLYVLVKGPHRDKTELSLGMVDPADVLQVTLGDRTEINRGLVYKYPLSIEIHPGSRNLNRLGTKTSSYAEIHIQSEHPEAKDVPVYVEFAIQG